MRSSDETLAASLPFITQARLLMSERELRGTARVLRQTIPDVVAFNRTSVPFLRENRALSACTNNVLVPFMDLEIPNPESGNEAENCDQQVRAAAPARLPGPLGREPPLRRQQPVLPRRRHAARRPRAAGPAARRRQHADAAPAGRAVREAGAAEPARARRPDPGLPGARREPGLGDQAAGSDAARPAAFVDAAQNFVDNALPLVAKERAAYAAA